MLYSMHNMATDWWCAIIIIIISIKRGWQCKAEREWYTPISPNTPAPQYQPTDRKKRKGKIVEDNSTDRAA